MSKSKRLALFQIGSEAAARVLRTRAGIYVCPLCAKGFAKQAVATGALTLEHVPPASVGGRGIVLTCRNCNSTAGHAMDYAVQGWKKLEQFHELVLKGGSDFTGPARLTIDGTALNVMLSRADDGAIVMAIRGDANNPAAIKKVADYMDRSASEGFGEGQTYHLSVTAKYKARDAKLSRLRAAFLVAFAKFGYRYAFDNRLRPVREQLLSPDQEVISGWMFSPDESKGQECLVLVSEPVCLAVLTATWGVLLPWLEGPDDIYSALGERYEPGSRCSLSGRIVQWPARLEMYFDQG